MQIDRKVQEMENFWKMLGPSDKAQYKAKLTAFKTRHQGIKNKFARQEERLGNEKDQNTLRIQQKKGTKEQFDEDTREKLLKGTGDLNEMDNKLIDIERQGHETNQIMRAANKDLRNQRDVIVAASDKNQNIAANLKQGEKVIN